MRTFSIYRGIIAILLVMLSGLSCLAENADRDKDAFYLTLQVPGAIGTYPIAINNAMAVTGYYLVAPAVARAFLQDGQGRITTFSVRGSMWTEPESINARGDIAGFYEFVAGVPLGFIRYANGRIVTFTNPCYYCEPDDASGAQAVSINDFDEVAGNYLDRMFGASTGFRRSATGAITDISYAYDDYPTVVTGLNDSGTSVGFYSTNSFVYFASSFVVHPDGYQAQFAIPSATATNAEAVNAEGTIAGWYNACTFIECNNSFQGFLRSPDGAFTLFTVPGPLVVLPVDAPPGDEPDALLSLIAPHRISLNLAGTVTGSYSDAEHAQHGFVRDPTGVITPFDPPRGRQTTATSINDSGVIAGSFFYDWNAQVAVGFLRVPTPLLVSR